MAHEDDDTLVAGNGTASTCVFHTVSPPPPLSIHMLIPPSACPLRQEFTAPLSGWCSQSRGKGPRPIRMFLLQLFWHECPLGSLTVMGFVKKSAIWTATNFHIDIRCTRITLQLTVYCVRNASLQLKFKFKFKSLNVWNVIFKFPIFLLGYDSPKEVTQCPCINGQCKMTFTQFVPPSTVTACLSTTQWCPSVYLSLAWWPYQPSDVHKPDRHNCQHSHNFY